MGRFLPSLPSSTRPPALKSLRGALRLTIITVALALVVSGWNHRRAKLSGSCAQLEVGISNRSRFPPVMGAGGIMTHQYAQHHAQHHAQHYFSHSFLYFDHCTGLSPGAIMRQLFPSTLKRADAN